MTPQTTPDGRAAAARLEEELFAQLGLTKTATTQDIETARDAIVEFLGTAPQELRIWARREIAVTDEAYALISDPATDLAAEAAARGLLAEAAPPVPFEPATSPGADGEPAGPIPNTLAVAAPQTRRGRNPLGGLNPIAKAVVGGLAVVAIVTGAYVVYSAGQPAVPGMNGTPVADASAAPAIDEAQVTALMQKIAADPKDIDSLSQLGDLYFQAGDYKTAGDWMTKILAVDPKNVGAMLGLGAANFNNGDPAGAEKQWTAVIALEPNNQEAYYDLGFMYLSENPPDMANVTAMWNKVIAIDPTTDIAKTVQTHLTSFASAPPDASGGTAAGSPAASPAASPSPSASGN